jgi:hypothetical protein
LVIFDFFSVDRRALRGTRNRRHGPNKSYADCWGARAAGGSLLLLTNNRALVRIRRRKSPILNCLTLPGGEQSMDRVTAIIWGLIGLGAMFALVIY